MASLYYRGNAIWITYKNGAGKWGQKSTGYRKDNPGERRQAERLCVQQTAKERLARPVNGSANWEWVNAWMDSRWRGETLKRYKDYWHTLELWLTELGLAGPANVQREHCLEYITWRKERSAKSRKKGAVSVNTCKLELKVFAQILEEALRPGYCQTNVARKLGIATEEAPDKRAWTDKELETVDAELAKPKHRFGWLRVTYLLGRYQAARLRSCELPLSCVDLENQRLFYPNPKGGKAKAFSQPIDKRLFPELEKIVKHRQAAGATTLCDLPASKDQLISLEWRKFLDGLGIHGVSHHDLRRTWITKAALSGKISEALACQFSNHSSLAVHRIYQAFTTDDMAAMLDRLN